MCWAYLDERFKASVIFINVSLDGFFFLIYFCHLKQICYFIVPVFSSNDLEICILKLKVQVQ